MKKKKKENPKSPHKARKLTLHDLRKAVGGRGICSGNGIELGGNHPRMFEP